MLGHSRWSSGMSVKVPVTREEVHVALGAGNAVLIGAGVDAADPELVDEGVLDRPAVRDLPVVGVLNEHAVAGVDQAAARRVLVGRLRIPEECPAELRQILIAAQRELILDLRKRPHGLVVALGRRRVRRREPLLRMRQLRQARKSRLRDGVVGERCPGRRIDDRRAEPARQLLRRGHRVEVGRTAIDARALVVDQEEGAVPAVVAGKHHRPADHESELLLIELRRRATSCRRRSFSRPRRRS